MSILSAIYGPVPAPTLPGLLSQDAAAERDAPPPTGSDSVTIGGRPAALRPQPAGKALPGNYNARGKLEKEPGAADEANGPGRASASEQERAASAGVEELSSEEKAMVAELKARDAEVRAHESAHLSAGGNLASGASFSYQQGPDGQRYAVGGEVSIAVGGGGTPEERVQQAAQVRRAALAPVTPSGQDRAVAASATRAEAEALAEVRHEAKEAEATAAAEAASAHDAEHAS